VTELSSAPQRPEATLEVFAAEAELVGPSALSAGGGSQLEHPADAEYNSVDRDPRIVSDPGEQQSTAR
jgi:hypothetical protein